MFVRPNSLFSDLRTIDCTVERTILRFFVFTDCNTPFPPLSLLHFIPLSLSLLCLPIWAVLHHLYMYMVAFLALRILYVVALVCFYFCSLFFSPSESLPGKDVLRRLFPRPLPSDCFLFFSFLFRPCSPPSCFGVTSSIL